MSAVDEVQKAIDYLTKLKTESTPKPWHDWTDDLTNEVDLWHDQEQRSHIANCGVAGMPRVEADAELIVTLHRTIDAQLVILRIGREVPDEPLTIGGQAYQAVALIIARAINGATK